MSASASAIYIGQVVHRRHLPQRVQAFMAWLMETTRPYLDE